MCSQLNLQPDELNDDAVTLDIQRHQRDSPYNKRRIHPPSATRRDQWGTLIKLCAWLWGQSLFTNLASTASAYLNDLKWDLECVGFRMKPEDLNELDEAERFQVQEDEDDEEEELEDAEEEDEVDEEGDVQIPDQEEHIRRSDGRPKDESHHYA